MKSQSAYKPDPLVLGNQKMGWRKGFHEGTEPVGCENRKCHIKGDRKLQWPTELERLQSMKLMISFLETEIIFGNLFSYQPCFHFMDLTFNRISHRQSCRQWLSAVTGVLTLWVWRTSQSVHWCFAAPEAAGTISKCQYRKHRGRRSLRGQAFSLFLF